MKKILGLDLGTNSIGWALTTQDFQNKKGEINGLGSRIIPMSQDILGKFDSGQSHSQTANRTSYRGVRRLYQRNILRRERLHRVLNVLNFLPKHYKESIDFDKHFGQFKKNTEVKLNYCKNDEGNHEFIFMDSFNEMIAEFKSARMETKIPLDWTIYYLRKKALTKKISKEELAWVLLNFNQKRGYYQLRGEEEDVDNNKVKSFETLFISEVKDSGEVLKKTGEVLFNIYFENGWKYDKQTTKPENWLNKQKEFIVTTSQLKSGEIKRSFKIVDSEIDWIAIKKKTEQDIKESSKTVGQYIYEKLLNNPSQETPSQKIRGKLVKTIERKFYKEELLQILKTQIKFHSELRDRELYKACLNELYPRNEAHQNNMKNKEVDDMFSYLFIDDIIFYQRPLKSKKSTISDCPYEERVFKKNGIKNIQKIKCIAKSNPLFQEFRLWQFLKNLKIYQKENTNSRKIDEDITDTIFTCDNDWVLLFDFLNDKKEVEQKHVLDFLVDNKKIEKSDKKNYRWNYVEDKKYPANETRASFLSRLKKVKNYSGKDFLSKEKEIALWHIIYSVKDKKEYETAIKTFALKNDLDKDSFVDAFIKYPPFKNDYGAYSEKAIKKILPLMRMGKYWNETEISIDVKNRINNIIERLESIDFDDEVFKKDKNYRLKTIVDDEIPKQFIKSFINFKDRNPLTGLNTYQACYAIYERHSESGIIKSWKSPNDIDIYLDDFKQHSLRNPIVEQVVTETLRVVRDIWKHYGKGETNFFNEIHVELGREMKNSSGKREAMSKRNIENENTNERIKSLLEELKNDSSDDIRPYSPSHQEILKIYEEGVFQNPEVSFSKMKEEDINKLRKSNSPTKTEINKYKLWLEQGYISPYTGKMIPLSKLFSIDYQIEHIIPQSRYFDNSMANKIICESEVNQLKDNKTAYEFLKGEGGRIVALSNGNTVTLFDVDKYEKHCRQYFKKNRTKLNNLLSEDIPEGFINRQLNDSRYISKIVKTLLSNVVREEGEKEATTKRLVPVTGSITSRLKQDWGLNDKWNELIAPRFMRLNELTNSKDFGEWDSKINAFRTKVPDEISRGFSKKRIDHRHHALDALIIACCTKRHTNYLGSLNSERENYGLKESLLIKNKQGDFTKYFQLPWVNFSIEAKENLEKTIISFKQNLRIINKTNNKTWQWKLQKNGSYKKELEKQKGPENSNNKTNWAIRKPLHEDTFYGEITEKNNKGKLKIRTLIDESFDKLKIEEKVYNVSIQRILLNHLKQEKYNGIYDKNGKQIKPSFLAFSNEGIDEMNKNIIKLNDNKFHNKIKKVKIIHEKGKKFSVKSILKKETKFAKSATGTNLFFCVYENKVLGRSYYTPSFEELIEIQKQEAHIKFKDKHNVPKFILDKKNNKYNLKFYLQPNDLVYLPTDEEKDNPNLINLENLKKSQVQRMYKFTDGSGTTANFIPSNISKVIFNLKKTEQTKRKVSFPIQNEFGVGSPQSKNQKSINGNMIKENCWKLKINRLGEIIRLMR
jgi:CRISPR-associated endonuclease Csn1